MSNRVEYEVRELEWWNPSDELNLLNSWGDRGYILCNVVFNVEDGVTSARYYLYRPICEY